MEVELVLKVDAFCPSVCGPSVNSTCTFDATCGSTKTVADGCNAGGMGLQCRWCGEANGELLGGGEPCPALLSSVNDQLDAASAAHSMAAGAQTVLTLRTVFELISIGGAGEELVAPLQAAASQALCAAQPPSPPPASTSSPISSLGAEVAVVDMCKVTVSLGQPTAYTQSSTAFSSGARRLQLPSTISLGSAYSILLERDASTPAAEMRRIDAMLTGGKAVGEEIMAHVPSMGAGLSALTNVSLTGTATTTNTSLVALLRMVSVRQDAQDRGSAGEDDSGGSATATAAGAHVDQAVQECDLYNEVAAGALAVSIALGSNASGDISGGGGGGPFEALFGASLTVKYAAESSSRNASFVLASSSEVAVPCDLALQGVPPPLPPPPSPSALSPTPGQLGGTSLNGDSMAGLSLKEEADKVPFIAGGIAGGLGFIAIALCVWLYCKARYECQWRCGLCWRRKHSSGTTNVALPLHSMVAAHNTSCHAKEVVVGLDETGAAHNPSCHAKEVAVGLDQVVGLDAQSTNTPGSGGPQVLSPPSASSHDRQDSLGEKGSSPASVTWSSPLTEQEETPHKESGQGAGVGVQMTGEAPHKEKVRRRRLSSPQQRAQAAGVEPHAFAEQRASKTRSLEPPRWYSHAGYPSLPQGAEFDSQRSLFAELPESERTQNTTIIDIKTCDVFRHTQISWLQQEETHVEEQNTKKRRHRQESRDQRRQQRQEAQQQQEANQRNMRCVNSQTHQREARELVFGVVQEQRYRRTPGWKQEQPMKLDWDAASECSSTSSNPNHHPSGVWASDWLLSARLPCLTWHNQLCLDRP